MELTPAAQMRRNIRTATTNPAAQSEKSEKSEKSDKKPSVQAQTDSFSISRQALAYIEELNRKNQELAQKAKRKTLDAAADSGDGGEAEALAKQMKIMQRCQKIASRIMKGNKVPPQDMQYLMENDMQSYQMAMAARIPKKNPKEWDSVLEDEDEEESGGAESAGDGVEISGAEGGEAVESGGGDV